MKKTFQLNIRVSATLALSILTLFIHQISYSQQNKGLNVQKASIEYLLKALQEKHSQLIHYNPQWVDGDSASVSVLSLPLEEALTSILSPVKLEAIELYGNFIIVPKEATLQIEDDLKDTKILVGNLNEYGKFSRARMRGIIVDGQTGEPLIGAVIHVEKLDVGVSTGVNGDFTLELPVGEHDLKLSYVGYEVAYYPIRLVGPGDIHLELMEKSHALESVSVYAKKSDANITQTQMSMIKLDSKSIKLLPSTLGEKDVIKSITLLPGVQSVGEFGEGFNVRGGSADQNLILLEGVPLFNSSHLFGLTTMVNPDLISGITLYKGGVPAKYGERSASVMDIKLGGKAEGKFQVNGGIGLLNSRLSIESPLPAKMGYIALGGRSSYSNWILTRLPDENLRNSSANFHDINGLININLNPTHSLTIFGYSSFDAFSLSKDIDYNYSSLLGSVRWTGSLSDNLLSSLSLGHSSYNYQMTNHSPLNVNNSHLFASNISYNSIKWNLNYYYSPDYSIETGFNVIRYGISPGEVSPKGSFSTVEELVIANEQALELAAYISNTVNITSSLSLDAGLRFSQYFKLGPGVSRTYCPDCPITPSSVIDTSSIKKNGVMAKHNGLEPRVGIRYQLNPLSSLKLSYNRAYQYINMVSNTSISTPSDVWYLSNEHLAPTLSDQIAVGFFRNFNDNTIETSVEVYYKNLKNVLETKDNAKILMNSLLETDLINAKGYGYGVELYLKKVTGALTGWVSYTLSESKRRTDSPYPQDQINDNEYFPSNFDRPHNLVCNVNYQISRQWRVGGTFTYNTGRPVTLPEQIYNYNGNQLIYYSDRNKYRIPDYHRLDLSISYDGSLKVVKRWRSYWSLSVINLYSRKNVHSIYYQKSTPSLLNNYQGYSLYKLTIIGRPIPTLTYNFSF